MHITADAQCITYSNYIYCTDCPQGCSDCFSGYNWSYSVLGDPQETWCNNHRTTCGSDSTCGTAGSITVSVDCNGNGIATSRELCCSTDCWNL